MKNLNITRNTSRVFTATLIALFTLFSACDSLSTEDSSLDAQSKASGNNRATSSPVYTFAEMKPVGSSVLRRNENAISLNISTSELKENYTYTVWWVVFDKPELCSPPACGEDDVFEDALAGGPNLMEISILGAADGSLVGSSGRASYTGKLPINDASTAIFGNGLDNPMTAEIHYVIRSHGPAIPGLIQEQISTFNGGCDPGQPNEGLCEDVQFSVHIASN